MNFMQIIGGVVIVMIVASLCFVMIWNAIKGGYLKNNDKKNKDKNKDNKDIK